MKIDKEYLPHRYIMTTPETIKVTVKSKEQIADINFGAYKKPLKIIKTFFKKKKCLIIVHDVPAVAGVIAAALKLMDYPNVYILK